MEIILESPIPEKKRKKLRLPPDLTGLSLIWPTMQVHELQQAIAGIVFALNPLEAIQVQPIRSFIDLLKYGDCLKDVDLSYWFDANYETGRRKNPEYLTIECENTTDLEGALDILDAEAIVLFPANRGKRAHPEKQFPGGPPYFYEQAYEAQIEQADIIFEIAEGHSALNILGKRDYVLAGFCKLVESQRL